jgi:hypothetical protein
MLIELLAFYFNGHQWLASQLRHKNIPFTPKDNAFLDIADFDHTQKLVDRIDVIKLHQKLDRFAETQKDKNHRYKGFNLLADEDTQVLRILARGEFMISGFTNSAIRKFMPEKNPGQMSRLLKRLRVHGLIKKVGRTYKMV